MTRPRKLKNFEYIEKRLIIQVIVEKRQRTGINKNDNQKHGGQFQVYRNSRREYCMFKYQTIIRKLSVSVDDVFVYSYTDTTGERFHSIISVSKAKLNGR